MAEYIVNFADPETPPLAIVPKGINGQGHVNASTTLQLFGEGYVNWGEAVNENFVRLLETFASATPPVAPVTGQLWVDTRLYFRAQAGPFIFYKYDINPQSASYNTWVIISVASQLTAPAAVVGNYWYHTGTSILYLFHRVHDGVPPSWLPRSMDVGPTISAAPATPYKQVKMYDRDSNVWGAISSVLVTDSAVAPSDNMVGSLRFAPTTGVLSVWNGIGWVELVNAASPIFSGNIDMSTNRITNLGNAIGALDAINLQTGNLLYVNVGGDTMTGALTLNANPVLALHAAPKQYVESWAAPVVHTHLMSDVTNAGTAAAVNVGVLPANVPLTSNINGLHTIWVPAGAILPRTTLGAGSSTIETPTNKVSFKTLNFDTGVEEFVQFSVQMPKSWNESTITAKFVWSHAATTISFGVTWGIQAIAFSSGDLLDTTFGTVQIVSSVGGVTDTLYRTPSTPAVTIAGPPSPEDVVMFQVSRKVADVGDVLGIDARLHGVVIYYTTDALNDA